LPVLPRLRCPFPPAINCHADTIHENTVEWLRRFRVFEGEVAYRKFFATNIGRLAARFHPIGSPEILQLVSDWYAWMFFRDDQRDESELGKDPIKLAAMNARFLEILKGAEPATEEDSLAHALWDLRQRLRVRAPTGTWMRRFIRSVRDHFDSTVWEAANRLEGLTPDIKVYVRMRPITGGLYVDTEFIEITEHTHLPLDVRQHRDVKSLMQASNNVVCWANDIISLEKEVQRGDVHNLVLVLQQKLDLSLQEAVDRAAEMYDAEIQKFVELEPQLPSFGKAVDANLRTFVSVLRTRMRGNLDWSLESGRYQSAIDSSQV
jgi:5-epi-alpha-selinene synthase